MKIVKCDRCGEEIVERPAVCQVVNPIVKVSRNVNSGFAGVSLPVDIPVDLCIPCQKAVYDFIFGKEGKNGD